MRQNNTQEKRHFAQLEEANAKMHRRVLRHPEDGLCIWCARLDLEDFRKKCFDETRQKVEKNWALFQP
jgi:hypothetical protein